MKKLERLEKIRKNKKLWRFMISAICAVGVFCWVSLLSNDFVLANFSFAGSFVFCSFTLRYSESKRVIVWEAAYSAIVSSLLVIGAQLNSGNHCYFSVRTCGALLFLPFAVYAAITAIKMALGGIFGRGSGGEMQKRTKRRLFLLLLGINLAVLLFMFPGIYTYDMASWNEQFSMGHLTAHWSVTYNIVLAFFLDFGKKVFSSYEIGFGIAMALQAALVSYAYYSVCCFVYDKTKNKKALIASAAYFIINPFMVVMAITDAQDVCFGCLLVLFVLESYRLLTDASYSRKKSRIIRLLIMSFLLVTIRNNAIYCLILAAPFLLILKTRCGKKPLLTVYALTFVFYLIYSGPFLGLIGAEKTTSINEMLSVPSQQIAKVYYENRDSLTEEETKDLSEFYDLDGEFSLYEKYPLIADYTKKSLDSGYTKENFGKYIKLYIGIGVKNPKKYIEAFLLNSYGFWMPLKNYDDPRINLEYMNYPGFSMTAAFDDPVHQSMKAVRRLWGRNLVTRYFDGVMYGNIWYRVPGVAIVSSMGWYWIGLGYLMGLAIKRKKNEIIVTLLPIVGLYVTLLLAPVAIYRYMYPIAILVPIFFAFQGTIDGVREKASLRKLKRANRSA